MKFHYVYRITNKENNKHYYGSRTTSIEPKLDLGIKYFSSSLDKEFINEQKLRNDNFKYKIVRIFSTRKEADVFEMCLHKKFNVKLNKSFYNRNNAGSFNFTMNSENHWAKNKTPEEVKEIYKVVSIKNSIKTSLQFEKLGHWTKNKTSEETKEIYKKSGEKQKETKSSKEFKYKLQNSEKFKNKIHDNKGYKNPNAKEFELFDKDDNLIFSGKGNYIEKCKEIGFPISAFNKYKNKVKVYTDVENNKQSMSLLIKSGNIKFLGYKINWKD